MERSDLLALYDRELRRDVTLPGFRREALPHVVRHFNLARPRGEVLYSQLGAANADRVIAEQIADFARMGCHLAWSLYDHDSPADLGDRLAAHGFEIGEAEAVMVLDLDTVSAEPKSPAAHEVRPITNPDDIPAILAVQRAVWGLDFGALQKELMAELRDYGDRIRFYASYADNQPVCSAWIRFVPDSHFANLHGGSTVEAYRGQGHYSALLAVRAQAARARGVRFLAVEASPMSRPILEKQGFETIARCYDCSWRGEELD